MNMPYEPTTALSAKIARKFVTLQARRPHKFTLNRSIVSFTFDDFPRSSITNGAKVLEKNQWRGTFYTAVGLMGVKNHHGQHFSKDDVLALQNSGHEIAGHTFDHMDCAKHGVVKTRRNIDKNLESLAALGIHGVTNFAYPFGTMTAAVKRSIEPRFRSLRGVRSGVHRNKIDLNDLKSTPIYHGHTLEKTLNEIKSLSQKPGWLVLFTHDIRSDPSAWGCTPSDFLNVVKTVKQSGAQVLNVDAALDKLGV